MAKKKTTKASPNGFLALQKDNEKLRKELEKLKNMGSAGRAVKKAKGGMIKKAKGGMIKKMNGGVVRRSKGSMVKKAKGGMVKRKR